MLGVNVPEFVDKMGDHVVITTGTVGSGVASEVFHAIPRELALFIIVAFFITARLLLERAFHNHHAKRLHAHEVLVEQRHRAHPAKSRQFA